MARRRQDHPLLGHVVADRRHRSEQVVSGTTFWPDDRPRLPPNNTGCSPARYIGARCPEVDTSALPRDGRPSVARRGTTTPRDLLFRRAPRSLTVCEDQWS